MLFLIRNWLRARMQVEEAQTLTEYALILVLIAIVLVVSLTNVKDALVTVFEKIVNGLTPPTLPE
jgi:Flp pilus assembly pilin Flp